MSSALSSPPPLSQRLTARQRQADAAAEARVRHFEERRAAYTAMNRASRQFHTLLKDTLHRLRDGVYTDRERAQLEEARLDRGHPREGETLDRAFAELREAEPLLSAMRRMMRIDLGVMD
ncbi:hypothetical protein [Streptomyces sp. URMC 124]|uniref:hypothetical protein n=1 Tax=Streptomyces sp. URMC 124 TaxID=3423405 RepID=UPI003F1BB0F5